MALVEKIVIASLFVKLTRIIAAETHRSGEVLGGYWYFPNGERVGNDSSSNSFAINRGHSQILLFRNGFPSQRGRFHCEVLNASDINQAVFVNICKSLFLF